MSKNKFKKLKKKKHSKHPQYVAPVQTSIATPTEIKVTPEIHNQPEIELKNANIFEETETEKEEYRYVKKDVKKVLIVIGSIFVLLFVAYYVNLKTPFFHSMGDWLYNTLNIQTQ